MDGSKSKATPAHLVVALRVPIKRKKLVHPNAQPESIFQKCS